MVLKLTLAFALLAAALGLPSEPLDSCSVSISVTYPAAQGESPSVTCASQCATGDQGFSFSGVAYKHFAELDAYNLMVQVNYAGGSFANCELVTLRTIEQLAAAYDSCLPTQEEATTPQVESTVAPTEMYTTTTPETTTTPVPTTTTTPETTTTPVPTTTTPIPTTTTSATTTPAPVLIRQRCKAGFTLLGDSCYLVSPEAKSDAEGWQYCSQFGAKGGVIESQAEQDRLAGVLTTRVWLAISDKETEGKFAAPGTNGVSFVKWNKGEPNNWNNNEDCVMLIPEWGYGWNDDNCNAQSRALCEDAPIGVYKEPSCAAGQQKYQDSCYFFTDAAANYDTGAAQCRAKGGYPAVVNTQQEQDFLAGILTEKVYIGLTDRATESVFVSDFGVALYRRWAYGEPNNQNDEDCVQMVSGWGSPWYDVSCSTIMRTLCEIPAQ